jgi:hypothetical protein
MDGGAATAGLVEFAGWPSLFEGDALPFEDELDEALADELDFPFATMLLPV